MSHCLATFIKIPLTKSFIKTQPSPSLQHRARRTGKRRSRSLSPSCGTTRVPKPKSLCSVSPLRAAPSSSSACSPGLPSYTPQSVLCVVQVDVARAHTRTNSTISCRKCKLVILNCLFKALQTLFFTQYCRLRSLQQQRRATGACAAQRAAVGACFTSGTDRHCPDLVSLINGYRSLAIEVVQGSVTRDLSCGPKKPSPCSCCSRDRFSLGSQAYGRLQRNTWGSPAPRRHTGRPPLPAAQAGSHLAAGAAVSGVRAAPRGPSPNPCTWPPPWKRALALQAVLTWEVLQTSQTAERIPLFSASADIRARTPRPGELPFPRWAVGAQAQRPSRRSAPRSPRPPGARAARGGARTGRPARPRPRPRLRGAALNKGSAGNRPSGAGAGAQRTLATAARGVTAAQAQPPAPERPAGSPRSGAGTAGPAPGSGSASGTAPLPPPAPHRD